MVDGRPKGLFLALEGPEGSGKTTQAERLAERLAGAGFAVLLTREPGGTHIGEVIRDLLLHQHAMQDLDPRVQALLVSAARAQHVVERIRPQLEEGGVAVSDRFVASTFAYQGGGFGLDAQDLSRLCDFACAGVAADLTVLVDIDVEAGLKRSFGRRAQDWESGSGIAWNGLDFHQRVREAYLELARGEPERWLVVDGSQPVESVADQIWVRIEAELAERRIRTATQPTQPKLL